MLQQNVLQALYYHFLPIGTPRVLDSNTECEVGAFCHLTFSNRATSTNTHDGTQWSIVIRRNHFIGAKEASRAREWQIQASISK